MVNIVFSWKLKGLRDICMDLSKCSLTSLRCIKGEMENTLRCILWMHFHGAQPGPSHLKKITLRQDHPTVPYPLTAAPPRRKPRLIATPGLLFPSWQSRLVLQSTAGFWSDSKVGFQIGATGGTSLCPFAQEHLPHPPMHLALPTFLPTSILLSLLFSLPTVGVRM